MSDIATKASKEFENRVVAAMPRLRAYAIKLTKSDVLSDDLVQETVLRALAKHHLFVEGTNFEAWVTTILRNDFFSRYRKKKNEVEDVDDIIAKTVEDESVSTPEGADEFSHVMDQLDALDPATKGILLDVANGASYNEAAQKYGLQVGTIKSRINRARQILLAARNSGQNFDVRSAEGLREIVAPVYVSPITVPQNFGSSPVLSWIAVSALRVDPRFQREILDNGKKNVRSIAESFDWRKFGTVVVAPLDGGLFSVIDGQHRTTAALLCGISHVPCQVIDAGLIEQAEAFAAINGNVTALTPIQIHQAKIAAQDPDALRLEAVAAAAGATILRYPIPADKIGPGQTMAVGTLKSAMIRFGDQTLVAALMCLTKTRGGNPGLIRQQIIQALCMVLSQNEALVKNPEKAVEIARSVRFDKLWVDARIEASRSRKSLTPLLYAAFKKHFDT